MMVSIGAARGHKDMVSPFLGSAAYGVSLAVLDLLFVFGLDWGVQGAGYAASISQWVGAITIMYALERKGQLSLGDLKELPRLKDAAPYISMAPSLALSSVAALAPLLASSSIATSLGPDQLAAHTVLRQISSFWQQMFMAFNATAHSMIASSLSMTNKRKGMDGAARIMERICHLGIATSIPLSILLYSISPSLPAVFTENKLVNADVLVVLPVLLALMVCFSFFLFSISYRLLSLLLL
jgi:Na+-driven multidrug efflux pump